MMTWKAHCLACPTILKACGCFASSRWASRFGLNRERVGAQREYNQAPNADFANDARRKQGIGLLQRRRLCWLEPRCAPHSVCPTASDGGHYGPVLGSRRMRAVHDQRDGVGDFEHAADAGAA